MQPVHYIKGRASHHSAVRFLMLEDLRERRLGEDRRHSEEGRDPHPEDGPGAAHRDGGRRAREVSRSHLSRDRRGEGLERTHAVLARPFSKEVDASEDRLECLGELSDLDELEPDREVKSRTAEKRDKTP
ncbi:hypothetical protein SDC9_159176 [bioreactor metagenome]|uniref:Uncharacterized protein n=1 Tax=bioreactor metagenome TaxID=1076179 RepID=A0A645FBX9_9ZZZZ